MTAAGSIDNRRFLAGDGLRAVAALSILVHHAMRTTGTRLGHGDAPFGEPFGIAGDIGASLQIGLYIFFAISGYLIARPFVYALVRGRRQPSIRRYALARFLRIVPAFWLVWTITLVVDGTRGSSLREVLAIYGFGQVYDTSPAAGLYLQAWTLDIEMAFYVFVPIAALLVALVLPRLAGRSSRGPWLLVLIGVGAAASMILRFAWDNPAWLSTPPEFFVAFAPGIALAVVEAAWGSRMVGSAKARHTATAMLIAGALVGLIHTLRSAASPAEITAAGVPFGGLVVGAALVREWSGARAWRALANPVATWLGERSYGMYLIHLLVLRQLAPMIDDFASARTAFAVVAALEIAITAVLAALMWRYFERPAMDLRKRFRSSRPAEGRTRPTDASPPAGPAPDPSPAPAGPAR